MCGIAGWVDYARDLTTEADTARAMTREMALRGPDDEGLWLSEHAAIGHRRLAVIDIEGGKQPMVDPSGQVVLTYSGEVYNYRELRDELRARGHEFATESDTEVVLRSYLEWGAELVDRLNGMYAFAIWDGRSEELLLVRDRIGVKPLFFYELPDGILFGSEPKAILANPLVRRKIDTTGFCGFLTGSPTPGRTPFTGVHDLKPGRLLRASRDGIDVRTYWKLESRPHEDDLPETIANVRSLLEDIVSRQLVSDVPLCMLLSGGLDSSVLTALAQRAVNGDGHPGELRSFAVDFEGYAENFRPDDMRDTPDRPFVHDVAQHVGSRHRDIMLGTDDLFDPETRRSVLHAWDLPYHLGDMDISLFLLFRAIREHSTVAISGEAADEVFGGYPWIHDEAALNMPIFPWMAAAIGGGAPPPFSLFDPGLIERIKLGEYLMGLYSDSVAKVPHLDGEEGEERKMREVMHLHLTRFVRNLLDRKDRTSMAVGLEVRVPFCDHRLVEYVFNAPWSMKKCDGREKSLLRKATEDLLPQSVLDRRKAVFPATQDPRYDMGLRAELKRILDSDDEPVRPYLDLGTAREVADEVVEHVTSPWPRLRIESVVRMNLWLKEYDVDMSGL
ncbi:MAG TPA: asparagine synthase (glutamine-hydrolyzing) [Thermoleophilaceae bacterium]